VEALAQNVSKSSSGEDNSNTIILSCSIIGFFELGGFLISGAG